MMKTYQLPQSAAAHNSSVQHLPPTGYLRLPQVLAVFPVSKSTWYAGVKAGKYPKAIKLGLRSSAYTVESIRALIERVANDAGGAA